MKDKLGEKIKKGFVGLSAKACRYLTYDKDEIKQQKVQKMCNEEKT